jgi:hypothetical protein
MKSDHSDEGAESCCERLNRRAGRENWTSHHLKILILKLMPELHDFLRKVWRALEVRRGDRFAAIQ